MIRSTVFLLALLPACGGSQNPAPEAAVETNPVYSERPAEQGLTLVEIDLNNDGNVDVFNYYRERAQAERLLVRKEMDLNRDARIDIVSYYSDLGGLIREEMDGDFDGKVDWIDHYQETTAEGFSESTTSRAMTEVDTDYDGQMDVFKYVENGRLARKERDTDGNGRVDQWEVFDEQGTVTHVGRDTDGDGQMDVRE